MDKPHLTAQQARDLFRYDRNTGLLYRKHAIGDKTGKAKSNGYLVVGVGGRTYQTHRLIWLIMTGEWPKHNIDHINRIKTDNRWVNLRDVPQKINSRNAAKCKKTQMVGVVRDGLSWWVVLPEYLGVRRDGPYGSHAEAQEVYDARQKHAFHTEGRPRPQLRMPPKV